MLTVVLVAIVVLKMFLGINRNLLLEEEEEEKKCICTDSGKLLLPEQKNKSLILFFFSIKSPKARHATHHHWQKELNNVDVGF